MSDDKRIEELFQAFIAGFEASGEGFNGEYVNPRFEWRDGAESPEFLAVMRTAFDVFLLGRR